MAADHKIKVGNLGPCSLLQGQHATLYYFPHCNVHKEYDTEKKDARNEFWTVRVSSQTALVSRKVRESPRVFRKWLGDARD